MKKITLVMALFCAITLFGQHRIPAHVQELINAKADFIPVAPLNLSATQDDVSVRKAVTNATLATLNESVIKDIAANKYETIELSLPYNGSTVTLQLYRTEVVAKGFHVDTDKAKNIEYNPGVYYRGIVKGDANSVASFSFFGKEMNGVASSANLNNLVVGKLNKPGNFKDYIIYSDVNLNKASNFKCTANENVVLPDFHPKFGKSALETQTTRCVTVYFELDYQLFLENGEDTTLTSNWITSVFNNVQTLFDNDGITTAIKSVYIWTEQDPYSGESSSDYLYQFYYNRPVFDGDVAQLLGTNDGGLGGVAMSVGGLCTDFNVSYGDIDFYFEDVPVFTWTVEVITHELGHLYGSPHTHGCYWNGDNTAIDGCGTMAGYEEGNCALGPIPSEQEQGTIMSYCHLLGNVGINFANGFGFQPAQRITETIESSSCLSTDCINTCINTVSALYVTDTDMTTATLSWDDETGGPWQVGYAQGAEDITNWQEVSQNTYFIEGLNPNTHYRFAVRPFCNEDQSPTMQTVTFGTGTDWCTGVTWRDTGNNSNYPSSQHLVRIMKPGTDGALITVTFNSFETEQDYDILYVYDGIGTTAPLIGTYSGDYIPDVIQATNDEGALTFEFISDEYLNASGWDAIVSCYVPLGVQGNTFSNLSYYPNPVSDILTITSQQGLTHIAIYNVAGQLLMQKDVSGTVDTTDMSSLASGIYFVKVSNAESSANIRIIKE